MDSSYRNTHEPTPSVERGSAAGTVGLCSTGEDGAGLPAGALRRVAGAGRGTEKDGVAGRLAELQQRARVEARLAATIAELEQARGSAEAYRTAFEEEAAQRRRLMHHLDRRVSEVEGELVRARARAKDEERRRRDAERSRDVLHARFSELVVAQQADTDALEDLAKERDALLAQTADLAASREAQARLTAEVQRLDEALTQARVATEQARTDAAASTATVVPPELQRRLLEAEQLERMLGDLRTSSEYHRTRLRAAEAQVRQDRSECERLRRRQERMDAAIREAQERIAEMEAQLAERDRDLRLAEERHAHLRQKLVVQAKRDR